MGGVPEGGLSAETKADGGGKLPVTLIFWSTSELLVILALVSYLTSALMLVLTMKMDSCKGERDSRMKFEAG